MRLNSTLSMDYANILFIIILITKIPMKNSVNELRMQSDTYSIMKNQMSGFL